MKSFLQITQQFQEFTSLCGLAIFSREGRFIDTSLPLSDELSEEIGSFFHAMASEYRDKKRVDNVFTVEFGDTTLLYAEHALGATLFMTEGHHEIDAILITFKAIYSPIPVEVKAHVSSDSAVAKKKPFLPPLRIAGAAAALACATTLSSVSPVGC